MEISLTNGTWPRSQLHALLAEEEGEEEQQEEQGLAKLNSGRVGLDNLGNTCYMNSSLQALMHTAPLMEYFLSQRHMEQVNVENKFGHGGRLAYFFGRLANEVWTSPNKAISPRQFCSAVGSLNEQFAGHQQQDAQELLDFLLVGLSEDLNLVDDKPYTEHPDSDGRPDAELADIWWENSQKRDLSVVTSLFSGQFKSTTTCTCGYVSARFEPFNLLCVPIPEDTHRVLTVHIFARGVAHGVMCAVMVKKSDTLAAIVHEILSPQYSPKIEGLSATPKFVCAEVRASRINSMCSLDRPLSSVKDSDNVFLFEVTRDFVQEPETILDDSSESETGEDKKEGEQDNVGNADNAGEEEDDLGVAGAEVEPAEGCEGDSSSETWRDKDGESTSSKTADPVLGSPPGSGADDKDKEKDVRKNDETATPQKVVTLNGNDVKSAPSASLKQNEDTAQIKDIAQVKEIAQTKDVRVAFVQRKIKLGEGGGLDLFQLCIFGLPIVEVLPEHFTGKQLYEIISMRVAPFLKGRVTHLQRLGRSEGSVKASASANANANNSSPGSGKVDASKFDFLSGTVRTVQEEQVIGGDIPPLGFVLRHIIGGSTSACSCSRCPWLARCQGCFVPQSDDPLELLDGETLAIDWHMSVFEELVDTAAIMKVTTHDSAVVGGSAALERHLPLARCLEKFTETERLEGFVCPKCHEDASMERRFKLWRLPPVLCVQLKRFKFDHVSPRKLTNKVNFPKQGLDLEAFLASGRKTADGETLDGERKNTPVEVPESVFSIAALEEATGDSVPLTVEKEGDDGHGRVGCTVYDLYAVVHHIGALGGGHYLTTVRESRKPRSKGISGSHGSTGSKLDISSIAGKSDKSDVGGGDAADQDSADSSSKASVGASSGGTSDSDDLKDRWWLYNDGMVTSLADSSDVSAASAYMLFYMRRDAKDQSFANLFPQGEEFVSSEYRAAFVPPPTRSFGGLGLTKNGKNIGERVADAVLLKGIFNFRGVDNIKTPDEVGNSTGPRNGGNGGRYADEDGLCHSRDKNKDKDKDKDCTIA